MKLEYSRHAIERMRERGIKRVEVKDAVVNGQQRTVQRDGSIECKYLKGGKKLIVIYSQNKENYKIITTYYEN